jgi:hypothetical protein
LVISIDDPSSTAEDAGMDAIDQSIVRLPERHGRLGTAEAAT